MHTVSPSANINRFPGIYSYFMRVFKASLALLPAPEVKFGAWVLRDVKSHPVRTITCPCLLPSFLFLCCPAKAVRAQMKHSAVLNIPSMTLLMTESHNPKLCISCAPLGPWSWVRAHGAGRFPGGNPREDVPSLESRQSGVRGGFGDAAHMPKPGCRGTAQTDSLLSPTTSLVISARTGREGPGLSSWPGFHIPELPSGYTMVFFHFRPRPSQLQRQWYKPASVSIPTDHDITIFLIEVFYTSCTKHSP